MKRNIIAKTFTPIYDEIEDRIRFAINYQDMQNRVDFMITRSFILSLIPSAEEFIDRHYNALASQVATKVEPKVEDSNEAVSKTDSVNLELLRTDEELLLEVNFSFDANTKQTILTFSSKNVVATTALDSFLLLQVFKIIKSAIPHIKWGIAHSF